MPHKSTHSKGFKASNILILLPVLVLLFAFLSRGLFIPRVFHGDEIWTLDAVKKSQWDLTRYIISYDSHPPLYYIVSREWCSFFGINIPALRALSLLFSSLTLASFSWFYRNSRHLIFLLGIIATNPLFTYYSATVRPYAMMVWLATITTLLGLKLRNGDIDRSKKDEFLFFLFAFLLSFTHYFGTLYVWCFILFSALSLRLTKRWFLTKSVVFLILTLFWPILQILFGSLDQQIQSNNWVNVVPFFSTINNFLAANLPLLMLSTKIPQLSFGALLTFLVAAVVYQTYYNAPTSYKLSWIKRVGTYLSNDLVFLFAISTAVLLFGCIIDLYVPFTTPYYFLICLPATTIIISRILSRYSLDPPYKSSACIFFIGMLALQIIQGIQRLALP